MAGHLEEIEVHVTVGSQISGWKFNDAIREEIYGLADDAAVIAEVHALVLSLMEREIHAKRLSSIAGEVKVFVAANSEEIQ